MSIRTVVTEGYGAGGSIPSVVLEGYWPEASVPVDIGYPSNRSFLFDSGVPTLVIGDTFREVGSALAGTPQAAFDMSGASSIKACVISHDHTQQLTDTVELAGDILGADWESGDIAVTFSKTVTAQINASEVTLAKVEIQATFDGEDYSWFAVVKLVPGKIS